MSWLQRLVETYDACFGQPQFAQTPLPPIDHVEQQAHIEIVLDDDGQFLRASIVPKEATLIPVTEKSAGRTSGAVAHPLCDKLRYVAADYGSKSDHELYLSELNRWTQHGPNVSLGAILRYVQKGTVVRDLVNAGVLMLGDDGALEKKWVNGISPLAKLLTADAKTKERDQGNALIRWRVEIPGTLESAVWKHPDLQKEWAAFNATLPATMGLCLASGTEQPLAFSHPKRLRHGGDGAKLISSNDNSGYTFRGRFTEASEAYGLGSAATQKAHNALRWLIARQSLRRNGDQVIVSWSTDFQPIPPVDGSSQDLFREENSSDTTADVWPDQAYEGDAGQRFAERLKRRILGYREQLTSRADIVVMVLDSATPGRMSILYYRELKGSEFLDRIESWHRRLAWQQNFGKDQRFVGAPAPRDTAEAAYGRRVDEKVLKATAERLLPCILDNRPLPRDLVAKAVQAATHRAALEWWEFERALGVACSLVRGSHPEGEYIMGLDESRFTRDYLYGRLLAVADSVEEMALNVAGENRETNAARLMQRFADHPFTTWRTLELQLRPYIARLRNSKFAGALVIRLRLLDTITNSFATAPDGASAYTDNRRLSGEFLLGFHSQREALRQKKNAPATDEPEGDLE